MNAVNKTKEWIFKTETGNEVHPETVIFPITSSNTPTKPYRIIGTGFFIQKPGIFLTARHCLYDSKDKLWTDLTCLAHHLLEIDWLIEFSNIDLAIGQLNMKENECDKCKNHKVLNLTTWEPEKNEIMIHWGCNQTELELVARSGDKDYIQGKKTITGYKGVFEKYYPNGISLAKWPCYFTNAEFPSSASGGPVTSGLGHVCGINSTSSEGGGYSTAVLIRNFLDSKIPGHFLINDEKRTNDLTFREVVTKYGGKILEG